MYGISSALHAAISGLRHQGQVTAAIADNISNSDTLGFKGTLIRSTSFSIAAASQSISATSFNAGGVVSHIVRQIDVQGQIDRSEYNTHLAISQRGYFVVNTKANSSGTYYYTRAGDFMPDKNGYLVNTAGFYLQAWDTTAAGTITVADLTAVNLLTTVNLNKLTRTAAASTAATLTGVLKADHTQAVGSTVQSNLTVYDSLGISHNVTLTWTRSSINPNQWNMTVTSPDAASITQDNAAGLNFTTAANGVLATYGANGTPSNYSVNGVAMAPPNMYINWANSPASNSNISLSLGTIGLFDGVASLGMGQSNISNSTDGNTISNLVKVHFDEDGLLIATYGDGQARTPYELPKFTP
jgi:flagellar hook protein FlgE